MIRMLLKMGQLYVGRLGLMNMLKLWFLQTLQEAFIKRRKE